MPTPLTASEIDNYRARICVEAEKQCIELGPSAVSMRSLAKALGCSATTPYTYFENKEEIIAEVRAAIMNRVCELLEEIGTRGLGAADWARAHTKAFIDFAFDEPNAYRLIYDLDLPDVSKYPALKKANVRSMRVRTAYVEKLIAEGYLDGDAITLGYLYFASLHGLIVLRMTGRPLSSREDFDRTCQRMLKLVTRGAKGTVVLKLDLGSEGESAVRRKLPSTPAKTSSAKRAPKAKQMAKRRSAVEDH